MIFHCLDIPHFVYLSIYGLSVCFHFFAYCEEHYHKHGCGNIFFFYSTFNSFGFIPNRGIAGSWNSPIFNFLELIFCSGCSVPIWETGTSHQGCTGVLIFPYLCQYLFCAIFIVVIQMRMRYYLVAILICILASHS